MDARDPPPPAPPPSGGDGDDVRITAHPGRGHARLIGLIALAVVAGVAGYRLLGARSASAQAVDGAATKPGTVGDASATARHDDVQRGPGRAPGTQAGATVDGEDPTPDLSDYVLPGEAPTMAEVIDELHRRGIRSGLGAFQPPGTSPPLLGLEVPDGFPLPEGYVRHHQATDDGQRIAPILMFSPDLRFVELQGRRVAVPANRVVPPELAPPGMPLRPVRIPPPRDGGGP